MEVEIRKGDLDDQRVVELLHKHLLRARAETAAGSAHALDISGLRDTNISFWTIWSKESGTLLGMGALKRISADHYELKSMHTVETARGNGVGSRMLLHLIDLAKSEGARKISLETGSWDYFLPAKNLYLKHGFVECGPFDSYVSDPNSVFMTLTL